MLQLHNRMPATSHHEHLCEIASPERISQLREDTRKGQKISEASNKVQVRMCICLAELPKPFL